MNRFKKKPLLIKVTALYWLLNHYFLCLGSQETVNLCLPLARRRAKTFLPFAEAILSMNPCLFLLFLFDGWNVLLLILCIFKFLYKYLVLGFFQTECKYTMIFFSCKWFYKKYLIVLLYLPFIIKTLLCFIEILSL